jgi:hypothetical protein
MNNDLGGSSPSSVLRTVFRGFLFGVGFSVALGSVFLIINEITTRRTEAVLDHMSPPSDSSAADFTLADVEELKHDGVTSIIGSVKNSGKSAAHSIQIQANLFNHGKFVDQYSTYIAGTIPPGDSRHFKIACGCNAPPAEHDSYKLEVLP